MKISELLLLLLLVLTFLIGLGHKKRQDAQLAELQWQSTLLEEAILQKYPDFSQTLELLKIERLLKEDDDD